MITVNTIQKSILFLLTVVFIATSAPTMSWIAPYNVENSENNFNKPFVKESLEFLALQFWVPNGGSVELTNYKSSRNKPDTLINGADITINGVSDSIIIAIRDSARAAGAKVMLCVYNNVENNPVAQSTYTDENNAGWTWDMAYNSISSSVTRAAFIHSLMVEMNRLELDGIEVDLEGPSRSEAIYKTVYKTFIIELRDSLPNDKALTLAAFASQWHTPGTDDFNGLIPYADAITTMGYQEIGRSASGDLSYLKQKSFASANSSKLMIGMPSWENEWQGSSSSLQLNWVVGGDVEGDGDVGMALWDLGLSASSWITPAIWNKIHAIKNNTTTQAGPSTTITTANNTSFYNGSPTFTWSGTATKYYYSVDNMNFDNSTTTTSGSVTGSLSGGSHTLYLVGRNSSGFYSDVDSITFSIDEGIPTVSITTVFSGNATYSQSVTLDWVGNDANGSITSYKYSVDNNSLGQTTANTSLTTTLGWGAHTLYIKAIDNSGFESAVDSYGFTVSKGEPTVSLTAKPESFTTDKTPSFGWSGTDPDNAITSYHYQLISGGTTLVNSATATTFYTAATNLANGTYTFKLVAEDEGGLKSDTVSYSFEIVDVLPPTLSLSSNVSIFAQTANPTFTLDATSQMSSITNYYYSIDSNNPITPTSSTVTAPPTAIGFHTIYAKAKDATGTFSAVDSMSFYVSAGTQSTALGSNEVSNGTFGIGSSGSDEGWIAADQNVDDLTFDCGTGTAWLKMIKARLEDWHGQLYQDGIDLIKGSEYQVSFDSKGVTPRSIICAVGEGSADFTSQNISLIGVVETYTFNFTPNRTTSDGRISFQVGISDIGVDLDNVSIKEVTTVNTIVTRDTVKSIVESTSNSVPLTTTTTIVDPVTLDTIITTIQSNIVTKTSTTVSFNYSTSSPLQNSTGTPVVTTETILVSSTPLTKSNAAPLITSLASVTAKVAESFSYSATATDNSGALIIGYENLPSWLTVAGNTITGVPQSITADTSFTVTASDNALTTKQIVTITIGGVTAISDVESPRNEFNSKLLFAPNPVPADADEVRFVTPASLSGKWEVTIYDNLGNQIDFQSFDSEGGYSYSWDLKNISGVRVTAGTYLAIISVETTSGSKEMFKRVIGIKE